jgi:hypothetical protein
MVAIRTGVSHEVWLADTRAMFTAAEILEEADRKRR